MNEDAAPLGRMLLCLLLLAFLTSPAEYLAHEGGHYFAAVLLGVHPTLHFDRISLHGVAHIDPFYDVLYAAAGPLVHWLVGIAALGLLMRRFTPLRLVLAIWVARPLQFAHGLLAIDLGAFGISGNLASTDEGVVATGLGISAHAIMAIELAAAVPLLVLIIASIPEPRRIATLVVLSLGVLIGWAAWLYVGPFLLP